MKKNRSKWFLVAAVLLAATVTLAGDAGPSSNGDDPALASVNGERITLDDLRSQIGSVHAGMGHGGTTAQMPDPWALLERMVNVRLIVQEARTIGLDELPAVTNRMEQLELELLKQQLVQQHIQEFTQADPAEVEKLFRESVREIKVESVLFGTQEDAARFKAAVDGGADFATLAREAMDQGSATSVVLDVSYLKASEVRPRVMEVVLAMENGSVSEPIHAAGGFMVVKLLEIRYPEDPEARREAEQTVLTITQQKALLDYTDELRTRYVDVDRELAESLDYQSGEGALETLREDKRIVAKVKGGEAITVGQLTEKIEEKFYHGIDGAIERNRVNSEVLGVLDRMGLEQAAWIEGRRLGVDNSEAYLRMRNNQEDSMLFSMFVGKVIDPDIKLDEKDLKAYYAENLADYTAPEMIRLESLAFDERTDAEEALKKLREGADSKWVQANADGQLDPSRSPSLLRFDGKPLALASLDEGIQKAVKDVAAGNFVLYTEPDGPTYVLHVAQTLPPRPQEYAAVREDVARRVGGEERQREIDDWISELRKVSEIEYFVDEKELSVLLGLDELSATEGA